MNRILCLAAIFSSSLFAQTVQQNRIPLPTSKYLTVPSPGRLDSLNGFTPTIALSPDQHFAALLSDGYGSQKAAAHQSIAILDLTSNKLSDFPEDRLPEEASQSYFIGVAFSSDSKHIYASIGSISDPVGKKRKSTGNGIAVYSLQNGALQWDRFIKIAPQKVADGRKVAYGINKTEPGTALPYPAGLTVIRGDNGDKLLVANNYSDNAILIDAASGNVLQSFDLSTKEIIPSSFPYRVVASKDGKRAWCSLWNASQVAELNLESGSVTRWIKLLEPKDPTSFSSHPADMLLSPDESRLYVALANADRVAVVPLQGSQPVTFFDTTAPGEKFGGSYPSALAQSADGHSLFVADASLNAVGVFDASAAPTSDPQKALGFIPTDWYPTALATVGNDLLIATSKGQGTGPNSGLSTIKSQRRHREHPYIPTLLYGSLARLDYHKVETQLPEFTRQVEASNLLNADPGHITFASGRNPIRHVIYILKENRTYDQVFGDLAVNGKRVGNGDPTLTMYGAEITPNEHKLALQFGVLDNFYDSGEVSGDGHVWSTAAITTDYNENTWQIGYRSRERTYDYQGEVADELPLDHGTTDIDEPSTGYIWDNVASHALTYRDYGEFVRTIWCKPDTRSGSPKQGPPSPLTAKCDKPEVNKGEPLPSTVGEPKGSPSPYVAAVPMFSRNIATKALLRGHFDENYPTFNTEYPDQLRADEFLNEFQGFVKARGSKQFELPNFVFLYLPDDHTHGTAAGKPKPITSVADNDLALGRVVQAVSESPYWDDTAIFVVEDDAQDGADHVDAHRSIAFVISKYAPGSADHPFIDSRFYTTVNMLHTIEAVLGIPAMNQNDAYAPVMAPLFAGKGKQPPFKADLSNRENGLIYQVNPGKNQGAEESAKMDFTHPDAVNTGVLNAILWRDRKGLVPVPKPVHAIFPASSSAKGKD